MADNQSISEPNIGSNSMTVLDTNHSQFTSAMADRESTYRGRMVEPGRMNETTLPTDRCAYKFVLRR